MNADEFNATYPIGTPVLFWPGMKAGEGRVSRTRTSAWTIGDNDAVVSVEGYAGGIALTHTEVLPAPLSDLPVAAAAASRHAQAAEDEDTHSEAVNAHLAFHLAFARD